jgi:ectoine hydroxylase-related dioxygenase (phytanoyl-CoA dioxygenase family)
MSYFLTSKECEEFHANGYIVIRNIKEVNNYIGSMRSEIKALLASYFGEIFLENEDMTTKITELSDSSRRSFYIALRYLPSITQLASSPILLDLSRQLQLKIPAVMHSYNIRMDFPYVDKFLFHWHQDITYLLGSKKSLTYWIPLSHVNEINGSVELIEKSHLGGLFPFHYSGLESTPPKYKSMSPSDIKLNQEHEKSGVIVTANPGDLVIFSQFILHRSTPNRSNIMRWVAQVRHSDLADSEFRDAGYPFGDMTNIFDTKYLGFERGNN